MPDSHRCYTKSGNVEIYEGGMSVTVKVGNVNRNEGYVTDPDSDGNYNINPARINDYKETSEVTDNYIMTDYHGVKVYKYYKYHNPEDDLPAITSASISFTGAPLEVNNIHTTSTGTFTLSIPVNCRADLSSTKNCQYGIIVSNISPSTWTSSSTNGTTSVSVTIRYVSAHDSSTLECISGVIDIEVTLTASNTVYKKGVSATMNRTVGLYT